MAPREPSRHQLSSRLTYNEHTPAFLRRLQNKVTGTTDDDEDDFDEWQASSGRPPIPRRPTPPQRPADDPGSADEDEPDEKPQVVVLREGKHLTAEAAERYAENERRKARGLPPLPDELKDKAKNSGSSANKQEPDEKASKSKTTSLSFSSTGVASTLKDGSTKKRKAIGDGLDDLRALTKNKTEKKEKQKPKAKKAKTGALLSFGDDIS